MSILNVNTIQPIGSGTTVTVAATELKTSNFITVGTGASVTSPSANVLTLGTNTAERLRIDSAGLVGIGTVSPSGSIHAHIASGTQRSYFEASAAHSFLRLKSGSTSYNSGVEFFSGASNIANVNGLGAGGLQFEVNGSERFRITSGGLVGIATAVPSYRLDIGDGATDPANGYQLRINANGDYIFALQRQSVPSFSIRNNSTGIVHLNTQNSKILSLGVSSGNASGSIEDDVRIDSNGHLTIQDGNLVIGTSGHGIDFSATGNGSGTMTSEVLDDYEEGTFTPAAGSPAISGTSPTYTGFYTKIGNIVTCRIAVSSTGNDLNVTSYAVITGLPFTSAASGGLGTGVVVTEDIDVFDRQGFVNGANNATVVYVSNCGSSSGTSTLNMTLVYTAA